MSEGTTVSREMQIAEAVRRLRILESRGLHENVPSEFSKNLTVNYSDRMMFGDKAVGIVFWLRNNPEWLEKVRAIEDEFSIVVYHATHELTSFGEMLDLLYVSKYAEEWEDDRIGLSGEGMPDGGAQACAYCLNLSDPEMSEFGWVGLDVRLGGMTRTW